MSAFDQEMLADFLLEAWEQLDTLDQEFLKLEEDPEDVDRIEGIFRVMHTLKGGAGFVALTNLETITHHAESLLSLIWKGEIDASPSLLALLLETSDAVRAVLGSLESEGHEGKGDYESLVQRLQEAATNPEIECSPSEDEEILDPKIKAQMQEMEALQQELMNSLEAGPAVNKKLATETPAPKEEDSLVKPTGRQIRVKVELLDKLMNLVGELVLSRNQLLQLSAQNKDSSMDVACQRINLVTSELQDNILQARMQPIDTVLKRFPRLVRDLAAQTGKEIRLTVEGEETALDRTILEAIKDPLTHILRNSIDHGLESPADRRRANKSEQGSIHIRAFHEGGQVTIEFSDDGRGVNLAKVKDRAVERGLISRPEAETLQERDILNLLFHPGFSTTDAVTNLSGRGVGMDVVKTSTESIGGTIDLQSKAGQGTIVRLRLPLTLAIVPALIIRCGGQRYAIPQVSLQEMVRLPSRDSIEQLYGGEIYRLRGELLPLLRLRTALDLDSETGSDEINVVVIKSDNLTFGLIVDEVLDTEEIVVKPLDKELKQLHLYAGATIMGDGRISLILDVSGLAAGLRTETEEQNAIRNNQQQTKRDEHKGQALLLFTLAEGQHAIPLSLVARLEEIELNRLEMVSGKPMVHYREQLLPLIDLSYELGQGCSLDSEMLQVLVFQNGEKSLGLAVDRILDVFAQEAPVQTNGFSQGVLGTTIVNGQAVTLVDVQQIISNALPEWLETSTQNQEPKQILMVCGQGLQSSMLCSQLETVGHHVSLVTSTEAALTSLQGGQYDSLILDLVTADSPRFIRAVSQALPELNIIAFNTPTGQLPDTPRLRLLHSPTARCLLEELNSVPTNILIGGAA